MTIFVFFQSLISGRNLVEAVDNSDDIYLLSKFDFWTKSSGVVEDSDD